MAIINTPKSFDKAQIDSALLPKIEQFVDYVNQQFDQLTRALANQLKFADNFAAKIVTVSAYNNKELSLNETASSILPLAVLGDSIRQYSATVSNAGVQKVTFKFGNATPIRTRSVSVSSNIATYEVENTATIQVGDKVSISSQLSGNSGSFIVLQVNAASIVVYNSNAAAATLTAYTGTQEPAKQVSLLLLS